MTKHSITLTITLTAVLSLIVQADARADAPEATVSEAAEARAMALGFRVGGYGFRNTAHEDKGRWDDCRMDGAGLFGQIGLGDYFFAEAGLDLYSAKDPEEMDRLSGLATVAAGARAELGRLSPYVQLGAGLEATRARHGAREDQAVAPVGFFGLGLDVRLYGRLHGGAVFRTNVMKHYLHHDAAAAGAHEHEHDHTVGAMDSEYEAANQGQFFLSYEL